ncbi:LacI family DNA-binding transcriptional regulator [Photobacterium chitinilyticum]|uniref:LacI family DNA-binding transcriptional regulator n=1 Tax=Photobacterium chitinilyticum TaxID=2485123 RepID=A0A444JS79_9GAMM|nr:LacI family DNA-binding transcriptional regulator [Photobacterium chitinilyticum]RWX55975.1 LacI family DNA-binding transcriptional regulator [Photobacterium chitinilyticum]
MEKRKRITIADIAKLAGVSKTTASMVLNGRASTFRIKEETRERVMAVARENHYSPNMHAKSLQANRSDAIGLVIPDLTNFGFASIARELEKLCRQAGLQLLIACSEDDPEVECLVVDGLVRRQIDGLIVASSQTSDEFYQTLTKQIPVLQLDRHIGQSTLPLVLTDAAKVTADLVETIAASTVSEFYYFGGQLELSPSRHRLAGFELGLKRAGLEEKSEWIRHRDYQPGSGYEMMQQLHQELGRLPEALFTASYTLLEGVLRYLKEHNCLEALVSKKMRLATFDNHDLLDCLPLNIDSVAQDSEKIAQTSFQLIRLLLSSQRVTPTSFALDANICWRSQ